MAAFDTLTVMTELVQAGVERVQAEMIAKSIAKVQGDTVTKDHLDLRIEQIRGEMKDGFHVIHKEMSEMRQDISFTKWTNKTILVMLGVIMSALVKIAFFTH